MDVGRRSQCTSLGRFCIASCTAKSA